MIGWLLDVFWVTWEILKDASVFLLVGFLFAGMLAVLVPAALLSRLVGSSKVKSVLWASTLGAPLPLCSCGVLPTALGLRKQGATPGATVAFMVATPETGIDSISLTYALTDPTMTIFRPIAGIVTAIAAGLATSFFGAPRPGMTSAHAAHGEASEANEGSDHVSDHVHQHDDDHGHNHLHDHGSPRQAGGPKSVYSAIEAMHRVIRYGFVELFDDIVWWLALGIVLSAVAQVTVPADLLMSMWGGGIVSMLLMLVLSIPLYNCASSSTPMAAALVLKGLSPGAALVYLLAGPATNLGSVIVLLKVLGRRAVFVYLAAVAIITLAAGLTLNALYSAWGLDPRATFGTASEFIPDTAKTVAAALLVGLLIASMMRTRVPDEWMWLRDRIVKYTGLRLTAGSLASARLGLLAPCFGSPAGCSWSNPAGIIVLALTLAIAGLAVAATCFSVDVAEYGLVTRFGRVVRVIVEPGFHVTAPFDRVVRLDKRILFSRPARSEYLTADKKNVVVDTLATWRIADPERFLAAFATRDAAEVRLADVVLAEIGAAIGRYPASVLISTDPAESRYEAILSEIGRRTSDFAKPTYGIEVLSVDLRSMALPELNREHVFKTRSPSTAKCCSPGRHKASSRLLAIY